MVSPPLEITLLLGAHALGGVVPRYRIHLGEEIPGVDLLFVVLLVVEGDGWELYVGKARASGAGEGLAYVLGTRVPEDVLDGLGMY